MNRLKKAAAPLLALLLAAGLAGCGGASGGSSSQGAAPTGSSSTVSVVESSVPDSSSAPAAESPRILIAYFTRSQVTTYPDGMETVATASLQFDGTQLVGNTAAVAREIQGAVGGELFPIQTVAEYPPVYRDTTDLAKTEQTEDARPALRTQVEDFADYDIIFLGYPSWWGDMPMALRTFLESYDFTGKTILPFGTHAGSGLGVSEGTIAALCPGATLLEGLAIPEGQVLASEETVRQWLTDAGLLD